MKLNEISPSAPTYTLSKRGQSLIRKAYTHAMAAFDVFTSRETERLLTALVIRTKHIEDKPPQDHVKKWLAKVYRMASVANKAHATILWNLRQSEKALDNLLLGDTILIDGKPVTDANRIKMYNDTSDHSLHLDQIRVWFPAVVQRDTQWLVSIMATCGFDPSESKWGVDASPIITVQPQEFSFVSRATGRRNVNLTVIGMFLQRLRANNGWIGVDRMKEHGYVDFLAKQKDTAQLLPRN